MAYKSENQKYFEAILTNKKIADLEKEKSDKNNKELKKRTILKNSNFIERQPENQYGIVDGFFLVILIVWLLKLL